MIISTHIHSNLHRETDETMMKKVKKNTVSHMSEKNEIEEEVDEK